MSTTPLRTGDRVHWASGEGSVLEDKGERIDVLIEEVGGYTIVEIERKKLKFINT